VSEQVATHANGPVIVTRRDDAEPQPAEASGPVLVGVDGSASSAQAIGFACDEAASRGASLVAVHAFDPPRNTRDQADEVLGGALADRLDESAAVRVERLVIEAPNPAEALLDVSRERGACLMVVGSRGRGGFTGLMLGSISRALLSHSDRPVAIVHSAARP
jgi:nucleotide-binding universal stress UspA family protein